MFDVIFSYPCEDVNVEAIKVNAIFKTDRVVEKETGRFADDAGYSFEQNVRFLIFKNKKRKAAEHTMNKVKKIKLPNITVKLVENVV